MSKHRNTKPIPTAGEAYAVPLEGGRFAVCRVLKVDELARTCLVANSHWIGSTVPHTGEPALRSMMRLTHHNWKDQPSSAWVSGAPPKDFIPIGNIPPEPDEQTIPKGAEGGWPFFRIQPEAQWRWDNPEEIPPPSPKPEGRFVLHRFNGDEVYRFEEAYIVISEHEQGFTLWFEVEADRENAQRCADTAEAEMSPSAAVSIDVSELDINELVGREFVIPGTLSDEEDSCTSLLHYFEHEPLRNNRITVLSQTGDWFRLRWTAVTKDVSFYDGSKPPTQVEIEGEFQLRRT